MKILIRKFLSLALSFSIATYALPGLANAVSSETNAVKVELTDNAMSQAIGAGNVDATMADIRSTSTVAKAVIANRSILTCDYSLRVVDINGATLSTLASGSMAPDTAKMVTGTITAGSGSIVQAKITNSGVPGLLSLDTSWPQ